MSLSRVCVCVPSDAIICEGFSRRPVSLGMVALGKQTRKFPPQKLRLPPKMFVSHATSKVDFSRTGVLIDQAAA